MLRGAGGRAGEKENVRHRARDIRDIDSLDDEHLAARVDPLLLKKTVENSRSRSLGHMDRGDRDRSPLRSRSPIRGRGFDYDDPCALIEKEAEILQRRQRETELHSDLRRRCRSWSGRRVSAPGNQGGHSEPANQRHSGGY